MGRGITAMHLTPKKLEALTTVINFLTPIIVIFLSYYAYFYAPSSTSVMNYIISEWLFPGDPQIITTSSFLYCLFVKSFVFLSYFMICFVLPVYVRIGVLTLIKNQISLIKKRAYLIDSY